MSTTIHELADNHETRARLLRLVAKRFPDVTMEALWKDGPLVPVLTGDDRGVLANDVMEKGGRLFAFFEVEYERDGETAAVFVCPGHGYGLDTVIALARLPEDARAALVKVVVGLIR